MKITIDLCSGFCFGIISAIRSAEAMLEKIKPLYCLGDIVHNNMELMRLEKKGLIYIDNASFRKMKNATVLIRAHGEPPETYKIALKNQITLIDSSCPVVLKLQSSIRKAYDKYIKEDGQVVIYGKKGHAEVAGLLGQTFNNAIVVSDTDDLQKIDYSRSVYLFAQTTQNIHEYKEIGKNIERRMQTKNPVGALKLVIFNTVCRLVTNRAKELATFSKEHQAILFVSDKKSSNGKYLFDICKKNNPNSYFISSYKDVTAEMTENAESTGICGATSTPRWLMHEIAQKIKQNFAV